MQILSHKISASSIIWVAITIVRSFFICYIAFQTLKRALRSKFADGSSKIIIEGFPIKESNIDSILYYPLDKF